MATTINPDLKLIMDLIKRIEFFKSSMEEHVLVASIEQELAKNFSFQVSVGSRPNYDSYWTYHIKLPSKAIRYDQETNLELMTRLESLIYSLEQLLQPEIRGTNAYAKALDYLLKDDNYECTPLSS